MRRFISSLVFSCTLPVCGELLPQDIIRNTSNQIDQLVANSLKKNRLVANKIIDDSTFVRRSYININGRIPTEKEARAFILEKSPNKRALLIDHLILSNGHKSQMFNFWADLLRLQTNKEKAGLGWHVWIRDAVDANMPYDQFVNKMLSASGSAIDQPAVGYYLRDRQMLLDNVSNTVQTFLGNRIGCAQCHDHPTEDLTQKQYYEIAAFSSANYFRNDDAHYLMKTAAATELGIRVSKSTVSKDLKRLEKNIPADKKTAFNVLGREYGYLLRGIGLDKIALPEKPKQVLKIPHDYQYNDAKPGDKVTPSVFFGQKILTSHPSQNKKAFADWITNPKNPYFTKVIVNRLWAQAFGKGIVEPLDDWSETTTVSNPELLDYLTKVMIATDYDVREFMRLLYSTRLFESAVAVKEDHMGDPCDFTGPVLRRMNAEELHDSLLTIKHGNQDSTVNHQLKDKWEQYVVHAKDFLAAPPEELAQLKNISENKRASRQDTNKYNDLMNKAKKAGDLDLAEDYKQEIQKIKTRSKEFNKSNTPEMSMMMTSYKIGNNSKSSAFIRASEKASPHPPSSLLRQFGASDRNTPEAAHTHANVPQALTLLNSYKIAELTKSKSEVMKNVLQHTSPEERLNALFLGIYAQFPTAEEQEKYLALTQTNKELKKLAHAMMTSKRFLFVQ